MFQSGNVLLGIRKKFQVLKNDVGQIVHSELFFPQDKGILYRVMDTKYSCLVIGWYHAVIPRKICLCQSQYFLNPVQWKTWCKDLHWQFASVRGTLVCHIITLSWLETD